MFEIKACRISGSALALFAVFLCLAPLQPVAAQSAVASFEDANRLFRDDLYWAALLRYRQAEDAGMDTPLLHYNTGVANYRAEQHIRARKSLLKAARDPGLRVLAQYNLGLNAYAGGNVEEALDWFRQARDQQENPQIRRLAKTAISRLQVVKKESDELQIRVEKRQKERAFTNLDLRAHVGFGNDDNIFRGPSQPYVDFSDPATPLVTPVITSGAYMPVEFRVRYDVNSFPFEGFFSQYRIKGRYYQDKELDNANEFSHEFRFGSEYERENETRKRRVYSAFSFAQHDETYFDPDDGTARTSNGELIDDRLNYVRYGPEINARQSWGRFAAGLRIKGQLWNYEETDVVPEYDHEYFVFGANFQYKFTRTSLLRLTLEKYSRRYGDRPSYDLNAQQLVTAPTVRYDYLEAGLTARQRISRSMWFGFGYERTERTDRYLGYNDYTRDQFGFEWHWRANDRFRFEFDGYYRNYDYPAAFAYNNPVAGVKTLEAVHGKLLAEFRLTPHLSIAADAEYRETESTDARIAYDRLLFSLGITWRQ